MIIIINKDTQKKCGDFAQRRLFGSHTLYKKRGENDLAKIRQDIYCGALAEFAVYNYLQMDNLDCSEPDLQIYASKAKSYAPDLVAGGKNIHVKSQSQESADRWGLSWTFQRLDPLLKHAKPDDFIALCMVKGNAVEIKAILRADTVGREQLFSDCRVPKYAATKKVIYYDELQASKIELWEL